MKEWLESVLLELDGISEEDLKRAEPKDGVRKVEESVGIANLQARRLRCLALQYNRRAYEYGKVPQTGKIAADDFCREQKDYLYEQSRLLLSMSISSVKFHYPILQSKDRVAFRKGWQVVYAKPKTPKPITYEEINGHEGSSEDSRDDYGDLDQSRLH